MKHFLQVTDKDFKNTANGNAAESGAVALQNAVHRAQKTISTLVTVSLFRCENLAAKSGADWLKFRQALGLLAKRSPFVFGFKLLRRGGGASMCQES